MAGKIDGGWGWMIVLGVTIINLSVLPVQQSFGLIFAERFTQLGITATQTSLILHLNGTITCSLGLISGPMMKRFSFRKVACFGGLTVVLGVCATAFSVSLPAIIISYCVIVGIGQGIVYPATSLALNTYFRKKRSMAMGFCVTLTGLGPILMPLLIAKLLEIYATTGTLLILAGIATHAFIGASLLRPFRRETKKAREMDRLDENVSKAMANEGNLENGEAGRLLRHNDDEETKKVDGVAMEKKEEGFFKKFTANLDLALLRDNRYIALVSGMAVSLVAETNFNAMIPFVLSELAGLERSSIATIMSVQAASDITGRLCVPLLAQRAGWTCRNLYVISLLGSTLGRTILSARGDIYVVVIVVSVIVGISKGTKAVFQTLIIPDYVPLERLPAASGIQMVCNGILSITMGPIIGLVRDSTESYVGALHFTSLLSLSCVVLWIVGGLWNFPSKQDVKSTTEEVPGKREETEEGQKKAESVAVRREKELTR